ncbi:MAG: hypothetical protein SFY70_03960 [Bacteroidia bacterium]|nr:hypothetical protein [Bacteroidia bacterium]
MAELSDLEFRILDSLYFVEPFENILAEVGAPENVVAAELRNLIARRWVQAMRFDPTANDYVSSAIFDTHDLRAYRYLATKEGLLVHSGRR